MTPFQKLLKNLVDKYSKETSKEAKALIRELLDDASIYLESEKAYIMHAFVSGEVSTLKNASDVIIEGIKANEDFLSKEDINSFEERSNKIKEIINVLDKMDPENTNFHSNNANNYYNKLIKDV